MAAWLNHDAAGKAGHITSPEQLEESKALWAACLTDIVRRLAIPPSRLN